MIVKCIGVRGVRDANDVKVGEAVTFQAAPDVPNQPRTISLNITFEHLVVNPEHPEETADNPSYGLYEAGKMYKLEVTKLS